MLKIAACIMAAMVVGLVMVVIIAVLVFAKINKFISYDLCR